MLLAAGADANAVNDVGGSAHAQLVRCDDGNLRVCVCACSCVRVLYVSFRASVGLLVGVGVHGVFCACARAPVRIYCLSCIGVRTIVNTW